MQRCYAERGRPGSHGRGLRPPIAWGPARHWPPPARAGRWLTIAPHGRGTTVQPPREGPSGGVELARLEAILFLSQGPLSSRKLAQLAGLADGTKARTLVRSLNRRYDAEGSAFRAEEVAGGFQLLTRAKFAPWLRRVQTAAVEVRLSAPAMETLAVVAYRQPALRTDIEAIRGVQCDEVLRQLGERGLVRVVGRSKELGRPLLYGTTKRFLQLFGLRHIDELPRPDWLRAAELSAAACPTDIIANPILSSQNAVEEKTVTTLLKQREVAEELADRDARFAVELGEHNERAEDAEDEDFEDDDFDDEDEDWDDEDEEEEEDEDLEEDTWEEVEDDEDADDEEWDDEEEDEDWDEDEEDDDDWEDEEEEEEEEEEE